MLRLILAFLIILLTFSWLTWRRLTTIAPPIRFVCLGMIFFLFLRPIVDKNFLTFAPLIFQNLIFLFTLIIISYKTSRQAKIIFVWPLDNAFLIFILISSVGLLFSVNRESSLNQLVYFFSLYLCYWIIINLPVSEKINKFLLTATLTTTILISLYGLYQYQFGFFAIQQFLHENPQPFMTDPAFIRRFKTNAIFSTFIYPPALAGYLVVMFMVSLGIFLSQCQDPDKKPLKFLKALFFYLFFALIILALILTKSKGGWLAFLSGISIFWILTNFHKSLFKKIIIVLTVFIILYTFVGFSKKIHLPKFKNFIISYQVRAEYWKAAYQMIKEKPLLGFGPGTFGTVYPRFKTTKGGQTISAHNSFLELASEVGLLGLSFFLFFWIVFIAEGFRLIRNTGFSNKTAIISAGIYSGIFSYFVHNFVDFDFYLPQISNLIFSLCGIFVLINLTKIRTIREVTLATKKKIAFLFFSWLTIFFLMVYSVCLMSAEYFDKQAYQLYERKNYQAALSSTQKAVTLNNLSARYRLHQALIFETLFLEKYDGLTLDFYAQQAELKYRQAIKLNPYSAHYHFRLGQFLILLGKKKEGLCQLKNAVSLYPTNPFYHEQLARLYDIMGQKDRAKNEILIANKLRQSATQSK